MWCGVLIIGSLWWDTRSDRTAWRAGRLDVAAANPVAVPIRYGRKSETRGGSFTMVFSPGDPPGKAILVPCLRQIETTADVVDEAAALWQAEAPRARRGAISSWWGSVGALLRSDAAHERFSKAGTSEFTQRGATALSVVTSDGTLELGRVDQNDPAMRDIDVILATATLPETQMPSPGDVADAWIVQNGGHESYFFNNVKHGVRTAADGEIWKALKKSSRPWLRSPDYAAAIEVLEAEADG
jgi:hypothetical protein